MPMPMTRADAGNESAWRPSIVGLFPVVSPIATTVEHDSIDMQGPSGNSQPLSHP